MANELMAVGDKIDLIRISNVEMKETSVQYKSKILDIVDDKHIKISMPMKNGRVIPLEVGARYRLWMYSKNSLYTCESIIEERYRSGNLFVLEVFLETNLKKLQRREYYRINCMIEIKYRLFTEEEKYRNLLKKDEFSGNEAKEECQKELERLETNWQKGNIIDLSGGGAKINIDSECKVDDILLLKFLVLNNYEQEHIECQARVIEGINVENKLRKYEYRIEFIELKKEYRDAIVKFIFEEERKLIRREKGMS
jgi:c-di-GMP-binding flagellar brake protein YcgR